MPAFQSHRPTPDDGVGADLLVVPIAGSVHGTAKRLARLGKGIGDAAARAIQLGEFDAKPGATLVLLSRRIERFPRVMLLGLGDDEAVTPVTVRRAFTQAARERVFSRLDSVAIDVGDELGTGKALAAGVAAAVDGLLEGAFRWSAAMSKKRSAPGRYLFLVSRARDAVRVDEGIAAGRALGESVLFARDLADTPANRCGPHEMAERAREAAKGVGLKAKILGPAGIDRDGLVAMRTVGAGSPREPRLIVLDHDPGGDDAPIALVGKGLVYDTGGLSLKPTSSMVTMKYDKCGGCAVLGAMRAVAALALPIRVVGVVPAVENSVSGESYRPGDVIDSRAGLSIDVQNTDAEGRVVLADALDWVIDKYAPRAVIDVATLTGASYVALGDRACAVLGNDDAVIERLRAAGEVSGERAWPLPLWKEYQRDVDSAVADVRNTSAHGAGTISGAAFLQRFVGDVPWGHLDIANVARDRRDPKNGATGFGVRLLTEALRTWPRRRARRR